MAILLGTDSKKRLQRVYGADFPGLKAEGDEWKMWVQRQFKHQDGFRRDSHMHYTRHDNFRNGKHWMSTRDGRTWKEPKADSARIKPVLNVIGPSLDFRLGIIMEQRPGFRIEPLTSGTAGREIASAQQAVVEYEFYMQRAWLTFLDALFWAQTHGVAFVHVYVDKSGGPEREDVERVAPQDDRYADLVAMGYEVESQTGAVMVPLDESGNFAAPDTEVRMLAEGVLRSRVVRANETLSDPEARSLNGPIDPAKWFLTKRLRDVKLVRLETGLEEVEPETVAGSEDYEDIGELEQRWIRGIPSFPTAITKRSQEMVHEYNVYIAPDKNGLPNGGWIRLVGDKVAEVSEELPGGVIPFARFTDGTSDPQMYPKPVMSDWIGDNVSVNALLGSLLQHAHTVGAGRVLAQKNTILEETYSKIVGSVLEYQGMKPEIVSGSAAGRDNWELLLFLVEQLENKTGWTKLARGQTAGQGQGGMQDVSGRALLASKELFERSFGPAVRSAAEGASEWARIIIKYAQEIYDTPRMIPMVGRADLAKMIDKSVLGDRPVVYVDPETLMPLPRALRHQMLFDHLQQGLITAAEYRKRAPYADIRDLTMGDNEQWERAQWNNTLIEERYEEFAMMAPEQLFSPEGLPVLWQDDCGIHKQALNEIILNDRKPWTVRKMAADRWGIYDMLDRAKADPQFPVPWEVVGVPSDRLVMQLQGPVVMQQPGAGGGALEPMAEAGMSGTPSSPAPEQTAVPSAADALTAQPLGTYGDVERQAVEES